MTEEIEFEEFEEELEDLEDEEEPEEEEEITGNLVGFRINCNTLKNILNHLKSSGKTAAGENVNYVEDCVLRVNDGVLWSICIDSNYAIFSYVNIKVDIDKDHKLDTYQNGEIPIAIDRTLLFLNRYSNRDTIEIFYENGMIVMRKSRPELENPINVEAYLPAIRMDSIRNDLFINVLKKFKEGKLEIHKNILAFIKKYKSPCIINKDKKLAKLYNGTTLDNFVELSCDQLKEVVKDGDLFENRIYPFRVSNNVINITATPLEESDRSKFSRDLYVKDVKLKGNFVTEYPSQFNGAVSSTRGHVMLFFGNKKQLLLYKESDADYGIDMGYIIADVKKHTKS